jgi:pimeloyl-ACP methyl ester carboxylesterase
MIESNKENQQIELSDGRKLGYAEYGDLNGKPIFHFHGYYGSRLEARMLAYKAKEHGVRLISVERPGMGLSDFQPKRTLLDWPSDLLELADHLNLEKFIVEGISGGGPYAAVCAFKIPDRLLSCGIIAGMGPIEMTTKGMKRSNRILFFLVRRIPLIFNLLMEREMKELNNPEKAKKSMEKAIKNLPEPDQIVMKDPNFLELFIEESKEAFRQGREGPVYEGRMYVKPWGFNLRDITPQLPVHLWHGELDINVPISMGRRMSELIPNCTPKFYPNEAHLSVAINKIDDILETLKIYYP